MIIDRKQLERNARAAEAQANALARRGKLYQDLKARAEALQAAAEAGDA